MVQSHRQTSHQPGARHAPYRFVSGYLFSDDIFDVYASLTCPVWLAHGVRGDFQDYRLAGRMREEHGWQVQQFDTGALPHFERLEDFVTAWDTFLAGH